MSNCACKCSMSAVKIDQDLFCISWKNYLPSHLTTDVSELLGKMQQINADIDYLKRTMNTQVATCETLRVVSVTLDNRLTAVEKPSGPGATSSAACLSAAEILPSPVPSMLGHSSTVVEKPLGPDPTAPYTPSGVNGWMTATPGETGGSQPARPMDTALGRTQPLRVEHGGKGRTLTEAGT